MKKCPKAEKLPVTTGTFAVLGLFVRTALEDRKLHAELLSYPKHAARVRYLNPGER